jgi:type III restriction enzyme
MQEETFHNPILNSPYLELQQHYHTNANGELDYENIIEGRRVFNPISNSIPTKQGAQKEITEFHEPGELYGNHIINLIRKEIESWRNAAYPNTTRVTKELLYLWFKNPERHAIKKLFFAQQEAIETAIWLNEVAEKSNAGQNTLN